LYPPSLLLPFFHQLKATSFTAVREELMRRYKNALLKPYHAANALRLQLLSGGPAWSHDDLAEALEAVTGLEEVQVCLSGAGGGG
jgi:secreted Zn-dependent insulinase-like peptidase